MNNEKLAALDAAASALLRLRDKRPLVMCVTNIVVTNWTANVLLALGAVPAMIEDPEEAAELAARSGGVLINVGSVTRAQAETMRAAITSCNRHDIPWVLDPVAADKLSYRRELVRSFIASGPRLIRGNAGEIASLDPHGITTLATGEVDSISDGAFRVANGVPLLTRVTGTGCAQGAIAAAFCAVEPNPVTAALATALTMAIAGELAFEKSRHLGMFQVALIDALDALSPETIKERAHLL